MGVNVACKSGVTLTLDRVQVIIRDELFAAAHPIPESAIKDWCKGQDVKHKLKGFLVVHRWHLVSVVEHGLFNEVKNSNREDSNWEQEWDSKPIHECHEASRQNSTVLVVHEVSRATVQVFISLDRGLLSLLDITAAAASI